MEPPYLPSISGHLLSHFTAPSPLVSHVGPHPWPLLGGTSLSLLARNGPTSVSILIASVTTSASLNADTDCTASAKCQPARQPGPGAEVPAPF